MQTYISILRGINVSGHKIIKMDALKKMYEDAGFKKVKTFIQSGNIIFQDKETDIKTLEEKIAEKIKITFLFDVPLIVKSLNEFETIFLNNPFIKEKHKDIIKLHVTFLALKPDKSNIEKLKGDFGNDEFIITDSAIYLFCPENYGNTKLNNNFFESKLKVTATTRNWKTVTELVNLAKTI